MKWERLQIQGKETQQQQQGGGVGGGFGDVCGPGKRWGHTCNSIKGGRFLYVFGGYGKDNCQTNQVHVFDTVKQTWSQPMIKGTSPTPRDSHSCTTVGDNLFVFGGTDGMNPLKDLHILDTSSHTWISPSIRGEGPEAREGHSATLVGKRLFIFGGCGKSSSNNDEEYYNDLYILNTETFVWKKAATSGTPPSARDSHSCSSWKNKIIVIGGEDRHDYYLSDVHILDADTLVWKELNTTGQLLPPRAGHCTVAFGKLLFVFGGFTESQNLYDDLYMLDIDTGLWTKVITTGEGPSARFSVAGDSLDPVKNGVLFFIGGCNKSLEALDDIYYLHTGLAKEQERRLEKLSLRKQLKLKCQEQNQGNDKAMVQVGVITPTFKPVPLPVYSQQGAYSFPTRLTETPPLGKRIFQAKVTENFLNGYTIETVIDGRPLRGVIFPNKPIPVNIATQGSSRKRSSGDSGAVTSNGDNSGKGKNPRIVKEDSVDHGQVNDVHQKDVTSQETPTDAPVAIPTLKTAELSNISGQDKVHAEQEHAPTKVEQEPAVPSSLNLKDHNTLNQQSSSEEVLKESVSAVIMDTVLSASRQDDRTAAEGEHKDTQN